MKQQPRGARRRRPFLQPTEQSGAHTAASLGGVQAKFYRVPIGLPAIDVKAADRGIRALDYPEIAARICLHEVAMLQLELLLDQRGAPRRATGREHEIGGAQLDMKRAQKGEISLGYRPKLQIERSEGAHIKGRAARAVQ